MRDDPRQWKAGRETDAKVARIMGWKQVQRTIIPKYTTTGDGMLLILEWARKELLQIIICSTREIEEDWECQIDPDFNIDLGPVYGALTYAPTAPLAVARAIGVWDKEKRFQGIMGCLYANQNRVRRILPSGSRLAGRLPAGEVEHPGRVR